MSRPAVAAPDAHRPARIEYIDAARAIAIGLAMLAHAFGHFDFYSAAPENAYGVAKIITRAATPSFLVIFGMMLEVVYGRALHHRGSRHTVERLLARAGQCYVLYLVVVAAGVIGTKIPMENAIAAALFLDKGYYGTILKVYSLVLVVAIPLLIARHRLGIWSMAAVPALVWAVHPMLKEIGPIPDSVGTLASTLVGIGDSFGPSAWHALTFVCAGMVLARAALAWNECRRRDALLITTAVVIVPAIVLIETIAAVGPAALVAGINDIQIYRYANHPAYFAYGVLAAVGVLCLLTILDHQRGGRPWPGVATVFGRRTLFIYTAGSVALSLLPLTPAGTVSPAVNLIAPFAFLAVLAMVTLLHIRLSAPRPTGGTPHGVSVRMQEALERVRLVTARGLSAGRAVRAFRGRSLD